MQHDFQDYDPASDPYSPQRAAPPRRKSSAGLILALIGVLGFLAVAACCGAGVWVVSFGLDVVAAEVEDDLRENPVIREHIGEIQEFKMNKAKSFAHDDDETYVYFVRGSKGEGWVEAVSVADDLDNEEVISGTLRLRSGEEYDLFPH